MKLIEKTVKTVLIEIPIKDINSNGFDKVWDELRGTYSKDIYDISSISIIEEEEIQSEGFNLDQI